MRGGRRRWRKPVDRTLARPVYARDGSIVTYIGIATSSTIINAAVRADVGRVGVDDVRLDRRSVVDEVVGDGLGLVLGRGEEVGEAAAGGEEGEGRVDVGLAGGDVERSQIDLHGALGVVDGRVGFDQSGADGGDVGAAGRVVGVVCSMDE